MKSFIAALACLCVGIVASSPLNPVCSEQCISYMLQDTSGPKVLRLMQELLKHDNGGSKTTVDLNGQTYEVSIQKGALLNNALRKGISDDMMEQILDYAGVIPTGTSSRTSQKTEHIPGSITTGHHHHSTVNERRPSLEPLVRPQRYQISTKNGDVNVDVNGQTLKVPEDLTRLSEIVDDRTVLMQIIKELQELGVPVKLQNNRVVVHSDGSSNRGYTMRVRIQSIDGKPNKVEITVNNDKYTLPGDERSLNRFLAREPEVSYQLLKILASHNVPVEYDQHTKEITTRLTSEEGSVHSRTSNPSSSSTKTLRIGSRTYYLPEDYEKLKRDILDGSVSATSVQQLLTRDNIDAPSDIKTTIRTKIITTTSRIRVMRSGDDVSIEMNNRKYDLPKDALDLQDALKENGFPIELLRDSLLRIGVDTRRVGSSLRIVLPKGDTYLSGVPSTKLYEYRVVSQPGGVQITMGSDVYTLPRDQSLLQKDIEDKKVLPQTLIDAFNGIGIPASMDFAKQEMTIELSSGTIRVPVRLNTPSPSSAGARLRLRSRGYTGNMVYTLIIGDGGDEVELPANISTLNTMIRNGKVDADLLMKLFDQMSISHYFDSAKDYHTVTLNGQPYQISPSPISERQGSLHSQLRLH